MDIPLVQLMKQSGVFCFQNSQKMDEKSFPYTKFELVQQVNNQHLKEVEAQRLEPV